MAKQVDTTYGTALFELTREQNKMDDVFEEAKELVKILQDNQELVKLLMHPQISKEEKKSIVKNTFDGRIDDDLTGLIVLVTEKDHIGDITDILDVFIGLVKEEKKIGIVYVTSAVDLNAEQKAEIENKIIATTKYEALEAVYNVDKAIIGGLIIRIGDRVVDSSIKSALLNMSKSLLDT